MRGYKLAIVVLAWAAAGAAQAFNLSASSENPLIDQAALSAATQQAGSAIGNRIPNDPNVKVTVFTRAVPSKQVEGHYIYLHRIELRRAFNAQSAPYPYAGWLPLETVERYGYGKDSEVRSSLDDALHEFFTRLQPVDPNVGFK